MTSCAQLRMLHCDGCGKTTMHNAVGCIHMATCGAKPIGVAITREPTEALGVLTARMRQVFYLLAQDVTCERIAQALGLSLVNVRGIRSAISHRLELGIQRRERGNSAYIEYARRHRIRVVRHDSTPDAEMAGST